jgi:hypothetical protein
LWQSVTLESAAGRSSEPLQYFCTVWHALLLSYLS